MRIIDELHMTSRRNFLVAIGVTGFSLVTPAWAAIEAGVRGAKIARGTAGDALSAAQAAFVDIVSDSIIPRTDTPGATDVGVVGFIDHMLAAFMTPPQRETFLQQLDALMHQARGELRKDFMSAGKRARLKFLRKQDAAAFATSEPSFFRELKQLVVLGYCTSEPGATQLLEYLPVPGGFKPSVPVTASTRNYAT